MHGLKRHDGYHLSDLANIFVNESGCTKVQQIISSKLDKVFTEKALTKNVALIIHEHPDNYKTLPIGGSGARVACATFSW